LAQELIEAGRYVQALTVAQRAATAAAAPCADSVEVACVLNLVGVAAKFSGRFEVAEVAYARALPIAEAAGSADLLATVLHNVGGLAHARGRFTDGIPPAARGLQIREAIADIDKVAVGLDCAALAALLEGVGADAEAERLYRRALTILDADPATGREAALAQNGLGSACQSQQRLDEAEEHYRAALAQFTAAAGPDHPQLGHILNNLATLHRRRGEDDQARRLLAQAHALLLRTLGADHPVTVQVAGNRARVEATPSPYV
jgi:tetratricopeptide (TPR) repeat protein